jgi:YebC/PmpR family DNA-binding regulatory protein
MSGHSKWATIKRKKGKADEARGKLFTRLIKEITVAARHGGGNPEANPRLRSAVATAKTANMPADNVERAIKKGTGELPGVVYEEVVYEGYGPGGVAMLVETLTDNKNRTTADLRHHFTRHGGNLGAVGCVSWMFDTKGLVTVEKTKAGEDALMAAALEAGAEDIREEDGAWEVLTPPGAFEAVKAALLKAAIPAASSALTKVPQSTIRLTGREAEQMLKLMDGIEECDDVQNVYANFDISEAEMERIESKE